PHVHGPALAPAAPGGLAEKLGHHARHVQSLGDAVPVRTVRGGDDVIRVQRGAHPDGRGLLTLALVDGPRHHTLEEEELHPFLELADEDHSAVQALQPCPVVRLFLHASSPFSTICFTRARKRAAAAPLIRRWSTERVTWTRGAMRTASAATTGERVTAPTASAAACAG